MSTKPSHFVSWEMVEVMKTMRVVYCIIAISCILQLTASKEFMVQWQAHVQAKLYFESWEMLRCKLGSYTESMLY
jgi:hypothetical protein